jgi:hypothetical protein
MSRYAYSTILTLSLHEGIQYFGQLRDRRSLPNISKPESSLGFRGAVTIPIPDQIIHYRVNLRVGNRRAVFAASGGRPLPERAASGLDGNVFD